VQSRAEQFVHPNGFAATFSTIESLYPSEAVVVEMEQAALPQAMDLPCAAVVHGVESGPPQKDHIISVRHACHDEPHAGEFTLRCCLRDKRKPTMKFSVS